MLNSTVKDMKKLWWFNKLKDGTFSIEGYRFDTSSIVIPEYIGKTPVTAIAPNAFYGRNDLETVSIPQGITKIGDDAFKMCKNLHTVTLTEGVKSIGAGAFEGCENLTSIIIPKSVKKIESGAFCKCKGLADKNGFVIIKNVLYSYYGDTENVTIPNGITAIEQNTFKFCI